MAATVVVKGYHDATGSTVATITAMRFKKADNDTADTSNRMPIPTSGTEYSYVKHTALFASTTPTALIDTCRVYGDGGLPTGIGVYINDHSYTDPTVQVDTALGSYSSNYASYTSSAKLTVAGSISNPSTGKIFTNYLQWQMGVGSTASDGVMTAETTTYEYLES